MVLDLDLLLHVDDEIDDAPKLGRELERESECESKARPRGVEERADGQQLELHPSQALSAL
eukprot:COSAG06_NODE_17_length_34906_cov_31.908268_47_plen_61_part_00